MALRAIPKDIPTVEQLKLPSVLKTANKRRGIILVTGANG